MKTLTHVPLIKESNHRDYIILLEDLEFVMSKDQLMRITNMHNEGYSLEEIMNEEKRDPYEIILALLHQTKSKRHLRPFAYREKNKRSG